LTKCTASVDTASAQVTSVSQTVLHFLPPGALPPLIINYSASSVPILQLGLTGQGLSERGTAMFSLWWILLLARDDGLILDKAAQ